MMKKLVFLFLVSTVVVNAQNTAEALSLPEGLGEKWLIQVEGDTVDVEEFWTVFNKNNFKQEKPTKEAVTEYFDLFQKVKSTKDDFEKLSIKFKELKSLAINYKDEKEIEIGKLKVELNDLKIMAEQSKNSYEEILDKTTKSIEKFIESAENDKENNIQ